MPESGAANEEEKSNILVAYFAYSENMGDTSDMDIDAITSASVNTANMEGNLQVNDLSGKTIIPFNIHLGSRFGRILEEIKELAPDATLAEGFTINAQTPDDEVRASFGQWLDNR